MFKNLKLKIIRQRQIRLWRKNSRKGVSLPLVTGLVTLLMVASLAANELIIRTIRSVRSVEASNRAFFAAEGGIEDGLYELSPHVAGYETPSLGSVAARKDVFDAKGVLDNCGAIGPANRWANCWEIESRSENSAWSEKMFKDQKLVISLYVDDNSEVVDSNAINDTPTPPSDVRNLQPTNFSIKFSIPDSGVTDISNLLHNSGYLNIDNDQDGKFNQDSSSLTSAANCPKSPEDYDCDGKIDEDSQSDPFILWKLTDNTGRSLIPVKGCLGKLDSKVLATAKSELCEEDFNAANGWSETLDGSAYGINENGQLQTIGEFFLSSAANDRMQFEFLIVAPMGFLNPDFNQEVPIPYIEYEVNSGDTSVPPTLVIPYPYFFIKSDGYYGTYKQSITTVITPKTSVPLFDFTIIQQQ